MYIIKLYMYSSKKNISFDISYLAFFYWISINLDSWILFAFIRLLKNTIISDPNIPETGQQAARALHSSNDDECCFHVCSEDTPESGICANCTKPWKHDRRHDFPTAPQCEINPSQSGFTGECNENYINFL